MIIIGGRKKGSVERKGKSQFSAYILSIILYMVSYFFITAVMIDLDEEKNLYEELIIYIN